jgi:epoxyqueuosine reductase
MDLRNNPASPENKLVSSFTGFLESLGLTVTHNEKSGIVPMRMAAMEAGLGIIRRNNFFYTENGSFNQLYAWAIDRELEWRETCDLKPCSKSCKLCQEACPTGSLSEAFTMNCFSCVSFLTAVRPSVPKDEKTLKALGGWLYGCDLCQEACPHNKDKCKGTVEFPYLAEISEKALPERILSMELQEIEEHLSQKFFYIPKDQLYHWKLNALNVLVNRHSVSAIISIQKLLNDPVAEVRVKAAWALEKLQSAQ